jgi:membrane protein DedA with SNARE-associated domain
VIAAAIWAAWIGIAAFLIGPPVARLASDVGEVGVIAIAVLIAGGVALEIWLHRRRRARA